MSARGHVEAIYPLTPMQHGMLFHAVYAPGSGVYVQQVAARLHGVVDPERFTRAWQAVVDRHPALRTAFDWERRADPFQVVYRSARLPWTEHDWSADGPEIQQQRIDELVAGDRTRGFALDRAPLMRVTLARLGAEQWLLLWTHHHLILDGWSVPLLLKDLFALYRSLGDGSTAMLDERRPFRDHVAWLQTQSRDAAQAFWTSELDGLTPPPTLSTIATRASESASAPAFAHASIRLPALDTDALGAFARTHGLTLSTVLQGAWAAVVGRFSGTSDVLYGATVSGRSPALAGSDRMLGLFINTLPVRVRLSQATPVVAWLRDLQDRLARQRAFEHTPLVDILGWSHLGRDRTPLETLFVFENYPVGESADEAVPGLIVESADTFEQTNFPLTLVAVPGRELLLKIDYETTRYEPALVSRLLDGLRVALASFVASPNQPLGAAAVVSPDEQRQMLVEWNTTARAWPDGRPVHELIDEQAERTPEAAAIRDGEGDSERVVTFADLRDHSNGLAAALRARGVRLDDRVGVELPRSAELLIAILGVMKAGAAYVPIDPRHPDTRRQFVIDDARVRLVLGAADLKDADPNSVGPAGPAPSVPGDAIAYVLYTSGSTGTPKGVMVTHHGLANYVRWAAEAYGAGSGHGAPLHSPMTFDLTVTSVFPLLISGQPVVIVPEMDRLDGLAAALTGRQDYSLVKLTPAHLDGLRELMPPASVAGATRAFVIGGEALTYEQLRHWQTHTPTTRLINEYGPTETVVGCAVYDAASDTACGPVPIGRPIANTKLYVLADDLECAPAGVAGELFIAGHGVARGYHERPALTAERFIPDPFSDLPGARMYRSGDRARFRTDGVLEFLGRADDQIKIRGHRIEPGEIEAALRAHPSVREAIVVLHASRSGEPQLAAFVAPAETTSADLRAFLADRLPEALIPATIVRLDRMPLTTNGKVDRDALAALAGDAPSDVASAFEPPRGFVEELVALAWCDVLGVPRAGRYENFFETGGHSLLATRLVARLRRAFGRDIPLRDIFDAPTVAGLAARIATSSSADVSLPLVTRAAGEPPVLSFAQQRLWFLHELSPASTAYLVPSALRVDGAFDAQVFARALAIVVSRHDGLRTRIVNVEGHAHVSIELEAPPQVRVHDLAAVPADTQQAEVARLMALDANTPFDLARPPLIRAKVIRLAADHHALLLTMHHLVSDAWSSALLTAELTTCYDALLHDRTPQLPSLPVQYADYARWQRDGLAGAGAERLIDYWKDRLADVPALDLPTDRPRPQTTDLRGSAVSVAIDSETMAALLKTGRTEHATPFMACLAVFELLLSRYTGQLDFAVGTPVAGRDRPEIESLIGFFMNTLVLRSDLSADVSFRELLRRVRKTTIDAQAHQGLPFEHLVDVLRPSRELDHNPLFQVAFTLQHAPPVASTPGLRLTPLVLDTTTSKFDLTLAVTESDDGWTATFEFRTDLFDRATIERMAAHYARLAREVAAAPESRALVLPLLTDDDRARLGEWNATSTTAPQELVHEAFEAQVRRSPEAIAVAFGNTRLTYGELNRRANQLARRLIQRGVRPDVLVGVCLERSIDLVVSLLAVLKAGGAYVPLDPSYPPTRLGMMLTDANVALVLTDMASAGRIPAGTMALTVDREMSAEPEDDKNPASGVVPESLAYVLFTSGSTGRPKGVMIPHAALANHMQWMQRAYPIGPRDSVLQKTPASFDASVWEFYAPLLVGGTLVVAAPGGHQDPEYLVSTIATSGITILQVVPSMLRVLLDTPGFGECRSLRRVFAGGEALTADLASRFFAESHAELVNLYGPTEATIDSVAWTCRPAAPANEARMPIGRPIDNTTAHVLDARLELVPTGVAGELYLGGVALGRGYVGQPALTADRFVPDPFGHAPGGRLYRTGDRVRRRADGVLEYLGRTDDQIKLRGFRIELGEIERALALHPSVRDAAVVLMNDDRRMRLIGYVAPRATERLEPDVVAAFLKERLPDYMLPAALVVLDDLPRLPNGKIDRRSLPEPVAASPVDGFVEPGNPQEAALADVWAAVLGLPRVSIRDNFFALGGDSILSLQVIARARRAGLTITPAQMFVHQTVEALAAVASPTTAASVASAASDASDASGPVPLTPIQRWFFELPLADRRHWNQAMLLRTPPAIDKGALERALSDVVLRHDALRLRFTEIDGAWRQTSREPEPALDVAPLGELPTGIERAHRSLDLDQPPLLRATWFDGDAKPGRLLLVAHHLVVDGVSWRVLLEDLEVAYTARVAGAAPVFAESTASFAIAARATAALAGSAHDELAYWRSQLDAEAVAIPLDAAGGNLEGTAAEVDLELPADRTDALLRDVPAAYKTQIGDILLASLVEALAPWLGRRVLTIDLEAHGRDVLNLDVSRTVGWFTTMFPVRLDAQAATAPGDLIRGIKEQIRRIPRKGIGYGLLRYAAGDDIRQDLAQRPHPAVSFNYLGRWPSADADAEFGAAPESPGPLRSPDAPRTHALEVVAGIVGGRMKVRFIFSRQLHRPETVAGLAAAYMRSLESLIDHCLDAGHGHYTPSDFTATDLNQQELDKLLAKLRGV